MRSFQHNKTPGFFALLVSPLDDGGDIFLVSAIALALSTLAWSLVPED